ncbi:MAG: hypothetical protein J6S67_17175 [Methanobrevibacter sp.]|nr:hypothetical protein [Methanobrevibacter sp.]
MTTTNKAIEIGNLSIELRQDKTGFYTVIVSEYGKRIDCKVYGNLKSASARFNAMKHKYL